MLYGLNLLSHTLTVYHLFMSLKAPLMRNTLKEKHLITVICGILSFFSTVKGSIRKHLGKCVAVPVQNRPMSYTMRYPSISIAKSTQKTPLLKKIALSPCPGQLRPLTIACYTCTTFFALTAIIVGMGVRLHRCTHNQL